MKALVYLYALRMKGNIRNVFSKLGSALFAIFLIVVYGGLFIVMLMNGDSVLSMYNVQSVNMAIFVGIAFTAFMVGVMLLQSRKSLFMEHDAFYLFSGPFKRSAAMQFLMSQSILSALMCGAVSLFMMVLMGSSIQYKAIFLFLVFMAHTLAYLFFTILYYYLYLLSIKDDKYKYVSYYIVALFVCCVVGVYLAVIAQQDFSLSNSGMQFLNSDLFYFVPVFGWIKMLLVSYVAGNMGLLFLGIVLLLIACAIVYYLMISFKGDFIEKAMQDAIEFTAKYKEMRAGARSSMKDRKIRNVKANFKEGAAAIFSKNLLLLRKSNSFIGFGDVVFIGIYLLISIFGDFGYTFFVYMMMFWLFSTIQTEEFMKEMNNYQIYLIPDSPLKKLLYLLAPYAMKYAILVAVPILLGGLAFRATMMEMLQNYILLAGYACLFISASVLSTRLLKSRNNNIMENMLRMLVILVAALPSVGVMILVANLGMFSMSMITWMSVLSLVMNFIVSGVIIFGCRSMMNGREIKSE